MISKTDVKLPSWRVSLIPFIVLVSVLVFVIKYFGASALDGASQIALLFASIVTVSISIIFYKTKWDLFENAISDNIRSVGSALLILLFIGAISGTWMISGIVPTLIYYGTQVITPKIFLFATCIICALISIMTGSSWTTIATIGVAMVGIGEAEGFSTGWTAGAIISGAYFGDKISPLSDTTVLAASSTRTPLFEHIRYMMYTTVPSFVIALIVFLFVSLTHDTEAAMQNANMGEVLDSVFNISPWLLIVPLITGIMVYKRIPALITLSTAVLMAGIVSLIAQPHLIYEIANPDATAPFGKLSFDDGFRGLFISIYSSTQLETGSAVVDNLVSTRGMNGMMSTVFLILSAMTFGGTLVGSGMMTSLTTVLFRFIKGRFSLVSTTVLSGFFNNMVTGDQYMSIILTTSLYGKLYKDKGYESRLLSRSVEDSATITSVLIPWNSCGMTQATVLKIATLDYLPYCIFNIISPLMSMFMAAIGYKIFVKKDS